MKKLYKNVDIRALESILKNGILPISETGIDDWESGKRADNARDVVYLFEPTTGENYFPEYGIVLLTVEVPEEEIRQTEIPTNDPHAGRYIEYTARSVSPAQIVAVEIPRVFQQYNALTALKLKSMDPEHRVRVLSTEICMKFDENGPLYDSWYSTVPQAYAAAVNIGTMQAETIQIGQNGAMRTECISPVWFRIPDHFRNAD